LGGSWGNRPLLVAALAACGPSAVLAMTVYVTRRPIARSSEGATLYEVRGSGPEGGGSLTYRVQGKAPGDAVEFVVSSDFSPGDGSQPQTVSREMCRERLAALAAELAKRRIPGVVVNPEECGSASRAGVVVNAQIGEGGASTLGPNWRDNLPADVVRFVERYGGCNHWGAEEPYSKERRKEIEAGARRLRCNRLDADGKKLRKKYAGKPNVVRIIDAAETYEG
jgi:hypothetical protein